MPQSLAAGYLRLVFSTKDRWPFKNGSSLRAELHAYLAGASKQLDCPPVLAGGVSAYVHLLARHGRSITQADWVKEIERVSTLWTKARDATMHDFAGRGRHARRAE